LAAAVGSAILGAQLGFHATADLMALVTAILGAIAGANLTLIVFDMYRSRAVGHVASADATPPVAAGAS
jgi:hypothetical protein